MPLVALVVTTLITMDYHDYSHKEHSPGSSKTHGNLTKYQMSQLKK